MITCIILFIAFHSSRYEDIITNLYIHLGVHIIESLSIHMQRMDTRRQYDRVYKKMPMPRCREPKYLKKCDKNLKKYKDEIKGSFMEVVVPLAPLFGVQCKINTPNMK